MPELAALAPQSRRDRVDVSLARRFQQVPLSPRWYLRLRLPGGRIRLRFGKTPDGYVLSYSNFADFVVDRPGSKIVCCNASGDASLDTIRHLLIDQVLPLVVNLRGREAIHATAVVTPNGICAFTGFSGCGKSTIAASFVLSGFPLVCDDCMVLAERKTIMAVPGYPDLRLWDDSIRAVGASSRKLKPVAHYTGKSRWSTHARPALFCLRPRRLARIYLLKRSRSSKRPARVLIRDVAPAEALMVLVKAAYRFDVTDASMLKRQFRLLSRVAGCVPVKHLIVPDDLSALGDVRQAVLRDLRQG